MSARRGRMGPRSMADELQMAVRTYIEFEKPIAELEAKVAELRSLAGDETGAGITDEIAKLEQKSQQDRKSVV